MEAFSRPQLVEILARPGARRVQLLCAPRGYGVSSVLRSHSERVGGVYVSLREHSSLARFAGDLVEALAPSVPGMQMTLTAAYERVLDAQNPTVALAAWFSRHVAGQTCQIALDHLDLAETADVALFVSEIIERSPNSFRWTLGSQSLAALPVASWMAHGLADTPLDEKLLAVTASEAATLAKTVAPDLSPATIERFREATRGCIADLLFFLRMPFGRAASLADVEVDVETAMRDCFAELNVRERTIVIRTALLPDLSQTTLDHVRLPGLQRTLARIRTEHPHFFRGGGRRYHSRFRSFLRARLAQWSEPRRATIVARTAAVLEATGDLPGALDLFVSIRRQRDILRLVELYAFRPMQSATASVLHDALAVLHPDVLGRSAPALTLRALSASLHGKSDVSETLFQHALVCAETPQQTIRIRYLYGLELLRRGRLDAIAQFQPDETFFAAPAEIRVAAMASLGVGYAMDGKIATARKWIARSLRRVARLRDGAIRARIYQQAAYVALQAEVIESAIRLATRALALGKAAGDFEVAASACSVLYVVAADFNDDPVKAASYLSEIATYGAKCGSIEKQLMAWVAAYEIEVERGDRTAVEAIERELGEFDVHYSARIPREALLPAQVLLTTWSGDFRRAYRTLSASALLLKASDREALRWAELAVYAAAAAEYKEAAAALVHALRTLKGSPGEGLRILRARLYCALAFALLDRVAAPRMMLATVRRDMPTDKPRLSALYEAVAELVSFRSGADNHVELWHALEMLRRADFGGVARMFEALPARTATVASCGAQSA